MCRIILTSLTNSVFLKALLSSNMSEQPCGLQLFYAVILLLVCFELLLNKTQIRPQTPWRSEERAKRKLHLSFSSSGRPAVKDLVVFCSQVRAVETYWALLGEQNAPGDKRCRNPEEAETYCFLYLVAAVNASLLVNTLRPHDMFNDLSAADHACCMEFV